MSVINARPGCQVAVSLPRVMQPATEGHSTVQVTARTVGEAVDALVATYPDLAARLFADDHTVHRFVNIYVDADDIRFLQGLDTTVSTGQQITLLSAVAGG
jgi:molybdopterin synthase sulfur carrier subunit